MLCFDYNRMETIIFILITFCILIRPSLSLQTQKVITFLQIRFRYLKIIMKMVQKATKFNILKKKKNPKCLYRMKSLERYILRKCSFS